MAETAVTNGAQTAVETMTEAEAKALHRKLNQYYRKRSGNKKKAKPVIKPRGKVEVHQASIGIEESATDLDDINDEPFSLVPNNVSQIWVKVGKERIKCVNTGKSIPVGGAAVYRLFL
jgi:hypothetical protein